MCCVLSFSVLADDVDDDRRGFLEFAQDYFRGDDDTDDADAPELSEDIATYDNDGIALMSVTTDDIDDGALTITMYGTYQSFVSAGKYIVATSSKATGSVINAVKSSSSFIYADTLINARNFADVIQITQTTSSITPLFKKGAVFDFGLSDIQCYWDYKRIVSSGSKVVDCLSNGHGWGVIKVYNSFGVVYTLNADDCESLTFKFNGKMLDIYGTTCALPCDVYKIEFVYYTDLIDTYGIPSDAIDPDYSGYTSSGAEVTYIPHHHIGFVNSVLTLSEVEQTNGLLQSIIGGITSIKDAIVNLPATIGNFIIDGIKSLFVPTEEDLEEWKDKFDTFWFDHLGFIYQLPGYVVDLCKSIYNSVDAPHNTVEIPLFEVDFGEANFSFGGYDVDLVPEGFGGIVAVLKVIVNIVCTLAFVNVGLRYFERILSR